MDKLIEALQIFLKYGNEEYPTYCSHDTLHVVGIEKSQVSPEDHTRLEELGFFWDEEPEGGYISFRYGSA